VSDLEQSMRMLQRGETLSASVAEAAMLAGQPYVQD
jgi:hypothetical protein